MANLHRTSAALLISFLFPVLLWARPVVLISDIDDTLKQSHIRSVVPIDALGNLQFHGMSQLYREWAALESLALAPTEDLARRVLYVTSAPGRIQALGRRFLKTHDFPDGTFVGRKSILDETKEFKVKTILKMLENVEEADVILVGDNGEHDPEAYHEVVTHLAQRQGLNFHVYIHQVYDASKEGAVLYPKQIPWLTSADLALQFLANGWVNENVTEDLLKEVSDLLLEQDRYEREKALSDWVTCNDFLFNYSRPNIGFSDDLEEEVMRFEKVLVHRCFRQ